MVLGAAASANSAEAALLNVAVNSMVGGGLYKVNSVDPLLESAWKSEKQSAPGRVRSSLLTLS